MTLDRMYAEAGTDALAGLFRFEPDGAVTVAGRSFDMAADGSVRDLAHHLYRHLHTRNTTSTTPIAGRPWRHAGMEADLLAATPRRASTVRARLETNRSGPPIGDDDVLVRLDGLRVLVPRSAVTATGEQDGTIVLVRVPSARPAISPGFFLVDGADGPGSGAVAGTGGLLRLYVALDGPGAATAAWTELLGALDGTGRPYRAKICSHPDQYPRGDALVVYLGPESWPLTAVVADWALSRPGRPDVAGSVFAAEIAPGVTAAWEPRDTRTGHAGLSFGQHRCLLTSVAVRDVAIAATAEPLDVALKTAFDEGGVSPSCTACGVDDPHPSELLAHR